VLSLAVKRGFGAFLKPGEGNGMTPTIVSTEEAASAVACPICGGELQDDKRRRCSVCRATDRKRSMWTLYEALRPILKPLKALNLTGEKLIAEGNYFAEAEPSVFRGENHIDIRSIDRPDESYDYTVCNHVLEHVKKDEQSIKELFRINRLAVQISVPLTSRKFRGEEYGFADPDRHFHWRHYGADFPAVVKSILPQSIVVVAVLRDPVTDKGDTAYFVCKTEAFAETLFDQLNRAGIICVVV
jgi:hypothetical protein